jgi:hypothetical protein
MIGGSQVYIVQTYRTEEGDTVLIEYIDAAGTVRLALPPLVAATIARQRESLSALGRKRRARAAAADRKARGIRPAFLKDKATKEDG